MCNSYNVRKLKASEIEVKPCQVAKDKSWVQCLLYKTSRTDMQVLTEMYGSKWKSDYKMVGDSLFCTISVFDNELNDWIVRTDCGEKDAGISEEKSYATSAFKRAATQFGIGIELYSTPRLFFNAKPEWFKGDKLTMTFTVAKIEWDGDNLMQLLIVDKFGHKVYDFTEKTNEAPTKDTNVSKDKNQLLMDFCTNEAKSLNEEEKANLRAFCKFYKEKEWTGEFNPERLWNNWKSRARK